MAEIGAQTVARFRDKNMRRVLKAVVERVTCEGIASVPAFANTAAVEVIVLKLSETSAEV